MPNKFLNRKGIPIKKQIYRVSNWSEYNEALKRRGDIEIWLCQEVINAWYHEDRKYDGTGTPELYTDLAIITCHEIRKVFRLPLRQCEGFINSLFRLKGLGIRCPSYSELSKRLMTLNIKCPKYRETDMSEEGVAAIAIDSTGLKRFGRDEWCQEKYNISGKRSWRKLHIAVDDQHYIQGCELTSRFVHDSQVVDNLVKQIDDNADHFTADGAYDNNSTYQAISNKFPNATIVISPRKDALLKSGNHCQRNNNIIDIAFKGQMAWQREQNYGRRNYSELAIQRYKRILGNQMQSREFQNQKQEAMIGCGVLNKMTSLGMPASYRI
jgi:hypothetical protein